MKTLKIWIMKFDNKSFWCEHGIAAWSGDFYELFELLKGREYKIRFCSSHNESQAEWKLPKEK